MSGPTLTRIKNNQITDSTIWANAKIVPGSIVGSLFNSNITVTSDFTITGNLTVQGASTYLTVASTNTYVNDPLIVLNNAFSGTNTYDLGFVFNRGSLQNTALIWNEFNKEFRLVGTTETGTTYGNINQSNFANLQVGNLTTQYTATIRGNLDQTLTGIYGATFAGNVGLNGPYITTSQATIALLNTNATTVNAFQAATSANVGASTGTFQINNPTLVGLSATQAVYNTVATTVNAFGAAVTLNVGANSGTLTIGNPTVVGTQTTQNLYNTTATTMNFAGAATTISVGASTGTTTFNSTAGSTAYNNGAAVFAGGVGIAGNLNVHGDLAIDGNLTIRGNTTTFGSNNSTFQDSIIELHYLNSGNLTTNDGRDIGLRMHIFTTQNDNAALIRANDTGFLEWYGSGAIENSNVSIGSGAEYGTIKSGNLQLVGSDLTGQILSATQANVNVFTANVTTAQLFTVANVTIGGSAGTMTINSPTIAVGQTSLNFANTVATTVNAFGAATTLNLGSGTAAIATVRGRFRVDSARNSSNSLDGALRVVGTASMGSNLFVGNGAVINDLQTSEQFKIRGTGSSLVFFVDPGTQTAVINGTSQAGNTATIPGATFAVRSNDSILVPVGTTAQRPSNTGNVDVRGMLRYNTSLSNLEWYDGSTWNTPGASTTVIQDQQINGDGTTTTFTVNNATTTNATIVSVNGVLQLPTISYAMVGGNIVFTEAPATGDVIDVRSLTTTTTISQLSSSNGFMIFDVSSATNSYANIQAGTTSPITRVQVSADGIVGFVNNTKLMINQTAVNISANATPYVIDTFTQTLYGAAKYVIKAQRGTGATGNIEAYEAMVVTDGAGSAYVTVYSVINNGYTMGQLSANVLGSNVQLYYTGINAAAAVQANVKTYTTYIV
jgi:hypothetical protein